MGAGPGHWKREILVKRGLTDKVKALIAGEKLLIPTSVE